MSTHFPVFTKDRNLHAILYAASLIPLPIVFHYKTKAADYLQSWRDNSVQSEQPSALPGFASLEFILIKRVLINVRPDLRVAEPQGLCECESQLSEAQGRPMVGGGTATHPFPSQRLQS